MKAKLVCESIDDILKPSDLGVYLKDVLQHMINVGYKWAFDYDIHVFRPNQIDYIKRMFDKGQDSKKTAYKILDYILDGESNKHIVESIGDVLKPVGMEFAIGGKKYYNEVWNSMVSSVNDLIKEINGIKNTNTQILNDLQFIYMKNYAKIGNNYKNGISAEETAKQILGINEGVSDVLKPQDPKIIKDFQEYMMGVLKELVQIKNGLSDEVVAMWSSNKRLMSVNYKDLISVHSTAKMISKR